MAKCNSCGAEILWAKSSTTGKSMPLNATPDPSGNIILLNGEAHVLKDDMYDPAEQMMDRSVKYKSHHATCPNSAQHRKAKKK